MTLRYCNEWFPKWWRLNIIKLEDGDQKCHNAASNGNLELLKDLISRGYPVTPETWLDAIYNGHFEIVKYLYSKGYFNPQNDGARCCTRAAITGELEILKWLRSEGFHWSDSVILFLARRYGHFELLQWAREHGCGRVKTDESDSSSF